MSRLTAVFLLVVFAASSWSFVGANEEPEGSTEAQPTQRLAVTSVDCYTCVSCQQVTNKTYSRSCPAAVMSSDVTKVKKCVKYGENFTHPVNGKNVSWVVRGCVSEIGSCEDIKKAYNNPDTDRHYCTECEGDRCNGVSRSVSEVFFAFFAVILVPIFGKYVLS